MKIGVQRVGWFWQKVPEAALEIRLNISVRRSLRIKYNIAIFIKVKKREIPVDSINYWLDAIWIFYLKLGVVSKFIGNSCVLIAY